MEVNIGDVLEMRKTYPCGGKTWTVLRVGMDFRIRCDKCGRELMAPRRKVEKNIKKIITKGE